MSIPAPCRWLLVAALSAGCRSALETAPLRMDIPATHVPLQVVRVSEFGVWPVVTASVGGHKAQFLVDTGTSMVAVSARLARELHAPPRTRTRIVTATGDERHAVVRLPEVIVGNARLPSQDAVVFDALDDGNRELGTNIDGVLGEPFFRNVVVTLDYAAGMLTISRAPAAADCTTPVRLLDGRPVLDLDLLGQGKGAYLLDTGSACEIEAARQSILGPASTDELSRLPSFDDGTLYHVELAQAIDVAGWTLRDVAVMLSESEFYAGEVEGVLGSGLFVGYRLSIDYGNQRVGLSQPQSARPYRGGWGMALRCKDDAIEIIHVLAGSPAHAAGLRPGDEIVHVDGMGRPATAVALCTWLDSHDSAEIEVEREGKRRDLRLTRAVYLPRLPGRSKASVPGASATR